jgi:hypothetical protein
VVRELGKRTVTAEWYNGFLNHPAGCGAVLRRQDSRRSAGACDEAERGRAMITWRKDCGCVMESEACKQASFTYIFPA